MTQGGGTGARDSRVLLLPLTHRDAKTSQEVLRKAGIEFGVCESFDALLDELARGAAAVAIAEERMSAADSERLAAVVRAQPPWSDLPVLMLTRWGADSETAGNAVRTLGNVSLLERPVRIATLVSALRTALRARQRQYQIRGHLEERERAAEALRGLDRRKDEFLATLAHELRNPLAPLLTRLQHPALSAATTGNGRARRRRRWSGRWVSSSGSSTTCSTSRGSRAARSTLRRAPIDLGTRAARRDRHDARRDRVRAASARGAAYPPSRSRSKATRCGSRRSSRTCSRTPPSTRTRAAESSSARLRSAIAPSCACATTASASFRSTSIRCSRCSCKSIARVATPRAGSASG